MRVQRSIDIAAPPEKIWPFMVEPEKMMQWYPMKNFRYTGKQQSGVDTPFYFEEESAGTLMKLIFVVTEWKENEKIAFKMTSGNFVKGYEQTWTIVTIPSGSRFTYMENIKMPYGIFGKFIGLFARYGSLATMKKMLEKLKKLAEA
jgi:uncharacterized protein YndB with AHSA1/START domain